MKAILKEYKATAMIADMKEMDSNPNYPYGSTFLPRAQGINVWRFELYLRYLEENPNKWTHIMLADTSDVVFQRNPFEEMRRDNALDTHSLHFFAEMVNIGYNEDQFQEVDDTWLRPCFGEEFIQRYSLNERGPQLA